VEDLIEEVEHLTAENQRLTSELNLARGRFEGAMMAAGWEQAATGES
jgi:cell shape-determining protein MreC